MQKIDDYSKPLPIAGVGGNKTSRDLAYTDLKTAFTSQGAFIDPKNVEYKTYKSVDELKRERSNINYNMTPEQLRVYENKKHHAMEADTRRQQVIRQRDSVISDNYSKTHTKMLGYSGNAPN